MDKIPVIDSHTAGEPTRVVLSGFPDLGEGPLAGRRALFGASFDHWRSAIACEPRGSDTMVGALLQTPVDPRCCAGVIFFNNVGYLGMCGHGTIGLTRTLAHLGRIGPGQHLIETPVGVVGVELHEDGRVTVDNVESYRAAAGVEVDVPGYGKVVGDVAWGGNWFFLCTSDVSDFGLTVARSDIERLTEFAWRIKLALAAAGITGDGAEVDHVELFSDPASGSPRATDTGGSPDSRSFVLCPGKAYDRSPCGTGTSAKVACLAADGRLSPGDTWIQESVIGSRFEARFSYGPDGSVLPVITGSAHVTAVGELVVDPDDPFATGIV